MIADDDATSGFCGCSKARPLTAGFSLGMLALGRGSDASGLADLLLEERDEVVEVLLREDARLVGADELVDDPNMTRELRSLISTFGQALRTCGDVCTMGGKVREFGRRSYLPYSVNRIHSLAVYK